MDACGEYRQLTSPMGLRDIASELHWMARYAGIASDVVHSRMKMWRAQSSSSVNT
jgi:hypothetical protein